MTMSFSLGDKAPQLRADDSCQSLEESFLVENLKDSWLGKLKCYWFRLKIISSQQPKRTNDRKSKTNKKIMLTHLGSVPVKASPWLKSCSLCPVLTIFSKNLVSGFLLLQHVGRGGPCLSGQQQTPVLSSKNELHSNLGSHSPCLIGQFIVQTPNFKSALNKLNISFILFKY